MFWKHIEVNIWKACNNKCRFCMSSLVWENEKELTKFELVKNEIIKYSNKWYKSIGFLWGDISIHPNIYKIINESKLQWFKHISIITNWMLFADIYRAQKLISSWVTRINISIHSHNKNIEDYLTQVNWWLIKKLKAIDNFNILYTKKKLLTQLSINIVLNWINYKDILKTCIFFHKIKNIKDIRINFIWNRFFFTSNDKKKLWLKYEDILIYLKQIIIYSLKTDLRITFDSIPACIFYKLWFKNPDYIIKIFLWEEYDYIEEVSNINMNTIFNWKEQKKNELKIKFPNCRKCLYNMTCQWVWKEYYNEYWNTEFISIV